MYTIEQAEIEEVDRIVSALGCELELNNEFLEQYGSEKLVDLLKDIDEDMRGDILHQCITDSFVSGYYATPDIAIPIGEIEIQFDGNPEKYFEDPDDWTIDGNLAYCTCVAVGVDIDFDKMNKLIGGTLNDTTI